MQPGAIMGRVTVIAHEVVGTGITQVHDDSGYLVQRPEIGMAGNGLDRERLAHDRDSSKQNARPRRKPGARTAALLQRSQEVEDVLLLALEQVVEGTHAFVGLRRIAGERAP